MRPAPFRRSHLGIATLVVISLIGAVLANSSSTPPVAAQPLAEPQFLTWEGSPFEDDLNHYLITVAAGAPDTDTWLQLDGDHLIAADTPPSQVEPEQINEVVAGAQSSPSTPEQTLETVGTHDRVSWTRPVAFGIYAVAGSISAAELAQIPGVKAVSVDPGLDAATVDPYFPTQWGLDNDGVSTDPWPVADDADIDAPEGWHRTRGAGVVVAVIDSGADITHPDLAGSIWTNPGEICGNAQDDDGNGYVDDCHGWDFANRVASVTDHVGHGTHVAGIIAAEADNGIGIAGVAYESDVMVLKIGDGTPALSAAIEAIAYAIDNGARVINASWVVDDANAGPFLDTAIAAAEQAGVLFVTAAGNEPIDVDASTLYPAASSLDNVITVGASTPTDQPASWSGYGATTVDIFAPGEHIISTVPGGYGIYSGTSMAAPMVTAAAALLWAATPAATYAEVKGALLDRSDGPNDGVTSFLDLATSDGRLNINRSIYSAPLFQPSLMMEFYEFNSFEPAVNHKVAITAKTVDPWIGPPQTPAMYRAGLYVPVDGEPMAVVGQAITYTGAGGDLTVLTDATGRALVGRQFEHEERPAFVQDGDFTPLAMELPAGTYAFIMEIVDVTNPETPVTMGDPSAVFFIVDTDGSITEMPQQPIGGDPAPATTTTVVSPTSTPQTASTSVATTTSPTVTTVTTTPPSSTTSTAPPLVTTTTTGSSVATTTTATAPTTTTAPASTTTVAPPVATTTTTTAPQTTTTEPAAGGGTTTTTSTTTTTTIPPDLMQITSVNPAEGPTAGRTLVTITGKNLPEMVDVYFGGQGAEVVSVVAPTFIVVDTPPGAAGWVNVNVVDRDTGEEAVLENGFLYTEDGVEPPPSTTTTSGPAVTTTLAITTTSAVATSTTLPNGTTPPDSTTTPPELPSDQFQEWRDSLLRTPEGLTLAPPAADDPINSLALDAWIGNLCDEPVCPGWVLED